MVKPILLIMLNKTINRLIFAINDKTDTIILEHRALLDTFIFTFRIPPLVNRSVTNLNLDKLDRGILD